jgi:hypothetical protein
LSHAFAVVGAHQEAARAARRIQHVGFSVADAKGVHHVHKVFIRVVLAEFVTLFRVNDSTENAPQNVC